MAKYLVVVESPAKAKTINKFLGSNYVVRASYGHVRDLPKSDLGVDIENNFEPKYVRLRSASKSIKELQAAAKKVSTILIASDPDREGEAIGWHVAELLKKLDKPVERIVFNEITKRSVKEAANNPRGIDENLVNAQQARRVLDRLVGYKLSPLLQMSVRRGLSAGRVQSVAVRMVCEREAEIRAFVPVEYWTLDALLAKAAGENVTARLHKIKGEKFELGNEAAMGEVLKGLEGASYTVESVEKKEMRRRPPAPFITSTLQQEAFRRLRFSPRQTMRIAQQLYEGIALGGEGTVGLITYMRTDSTRLANEALDEVRDHIGSNYDKGYLPEKPNTFGKKKDAQDAHEAIRTSTAAHTPESVKAYLDEDQFKLYSLIWRRFVACQMTPAVFDQTTVDIAAGDCTFRVTGSVMKFAGYLKLYEDGKDDDDQLLPVLDEGEKLNLQELLPEQHFTKPPARFSEATLIRAMEENGIGRPSTYAPTVNTIVDRGYVLREKGRLQPTELGEEVNTILVANFPDILDLEFTARIEQDLDRVEAGELEWHEFLRVFYVTFEKDLNSAQKRMIAELVGDNAKCPKCDGEMEVKEAWYGLFLGCRKHPECDGRISLRKKAETRPTDEICDKCGAPMVIRGGRFGDFMACSKYPECKNTYNVDKDGNKVDNPARAEPIKTEQKCPDCGAFLLIRKNRRGEDFYGCEKYPKCKFTKPMELNLKCVREGCEGELVSKMAKRRRYVGCEKYPECDFTAFGQLDKETPCPKCKNSWTMLAKPRGKPRVRFCPVPTCDFEVEIEEPVEEEEAS